MLLCFLAMTPSGVMAGESQSRLSILRADSVMQAIYNRYGIADSPLLRENYPYDGAYRASYLAGEDDRGNKIYSYLWPYSGMLSAASAMIECENSDKKGVMDVLVGRVIPGLQMYRDTLRRPMAYSSYITASSASDRFYDDNIWIGIDFADLYRITGDTAYLNESIRIWQFIESGMDDILGGGIYWCEQKKESKNTCSNAPGAVYALKLYEATSDSLYLDKGRRLYDWVNTNLRDTADALYYDNVSLTGRVDKTKFAYNSGQMLQASVLLFNATGGLSYLVQARKIAQSAYTRFFDGGTVESGDGISFPLLNKGNLWFTAVMMRGFVELYKADGNARYIDAFRRNLDYAWQHARNADTGLFSTDWKGEEKKDSNWLLDQAAMCEMYARLASLGRW